MVNLSIIVPVYNVEKYIRPSLESIFNQGLDEKCFEVIIVNDGTQDHSMEVITDILKEHTNITVIEQENQGLSVVRNNGIKAAKGEYILIPDSDDLLISNSLPTLLDSALSSKADIIVANFLEMNDKEIENLNIHHIQQPEFIITEKSGKQLFIEDLNPYQCYIWHSLFRRDFLLKNDLKFVPGIYFQDIPFIHECYIKANKCLRTTWNLNIYRHHNDSASAPYSFSQKKAFNLCTAIAETWKLTKLKRLDSEVQKKLQNDVYTSFSVMICFTVHNINKSSDRRAIIDFLRQQAPDIFFRNGIKQIIVSLLYSFSPHFYLFLRYFYGIIFEDKIRPFYYHTLKKI